MRLLGLELKRVLKTKITWIILLGIMLCSVLLAYIPTTFIYYMDENKQNYKGLEAIKKYKEIRKDITGEVTSEVMQKAAVTIQTLFKEQGVESQYELPDEVYLNQFLPISPFVSGIESANFNSETGGPTPIIDLDLDNVDDFYSACDNRLSYIMSTKSENAQKMAKVSFDKVKKPYLYYPGITSDAMDYLTSLIFLLLICCGIITAPIFATEYQTEADSILRCTKYGRTRLAVTKIISAFIICGSAFFLSCITWIVVTNSLFGWESLKTSVQMLFSVTALVSWNIGQLQWGVLGVATLSFFATISFILFLSAKCKTQVAAMAAGLFTCFLPVFWTILPDNMVSWIRCLWPTGAIGLQNGILYDFMDYNFLNVGSLSVWVPYAIIIFAIIEIPLFIGLTIRAYNHHTVN